MPTDILDHLQRLATQTGGLLGDWFAPRLSGLQQAQVTPISLPVCAHIAQVLPLAKATTAPAVQALIDAIPTLAWQQTYSRKDGFSQDWLDRYGWVNLVSPKGLFLRDDMRLSIGYWGAGQSYPMHSHAPEETYLILAGSARFSAEGRQTVRAGPGGTVYHTPHQRHAMQMEPGPLLAAAFWRGEALLDKSDLGTPDLVPD